jgi:hypothetical protein
MLNHILKTLGLPKRVEIKTDQQPALRRIAGLEQVVGEHLEDWQEYTEAMKAVISKLNRQVTTLQRRVAKLEREL